MVQHLGIAMRVCAPGPRAHMSISQSQAPAKVPQPYPELSGESILKMEIQAADAIAFLEAEAFKGRGWQEQG